MCRGVFCVHKHCFLMPGHYLWVSFSDTIAVYTKHNDRKVAMHFTTKFQSCRHTVHKLMTPFTNSITIITMFCSEVRMIKIFNPIKKGGRPQLPILIARLFLQGPFSSWPLLLHLRCFSLNSGLLASMHKKYRNFMQLHAYLYLCIIFHENFYLK